MEASPLPSAWLQVAAAYLATVAASRLKPEVDGALVPQRIAHEVHMTGDAAMLPQPVRQEIDHRTIKLLVGMVALTLAGLTSTFAAAPLGSISASYHEGGWSQTIFIGFLFAIAAFLLAYNGQSKREMVLSKVASGAAFGVALFPCDCGGIGAQIIPYVHGTSAAVMFLVLAYFCFLFYQRAKQKGYAQAEARKYVYLTCGLIIVLAVMAVAIDGLTGRQTPRLVFHAEYIALLAFGISWLTASHTLPLLNTESEQFNPFGSSAPPAASGSSSA